MEYQTNSDFETAYRIIEHTGANLFLTGRAGTGKTTFLRTLMKRSHKQLVVAAPTGIAAINAGGVTLHSLFQLDFGLFLPGMKRKPSKFNRAKLKLIRFMDVLVIDEVSMVRADLLDAVDDALRRVRNPRLPFGGVQLLLIGDLCQLPPVVTDTEQRLLAANYSTPYFFSSHALETTRYVTVELQKVYRQENVDFLKILGEVRDGRPSEATIQAINKRYIPYFKPGENEHWVRLTSHNATANSINQERMASLKSAPMSYEAHVSGNFPAGVYPAEERLTLKVGAQVMFIKNEPGPVRRYFNGMLGTVTALEEDSVTVQPDDGSEAITVQPVEWENITYTVNDKTGEIEEKSDGKFSQIPLRAAWAITIHKSQGLTFTHAIIDASACFAHGQAYVALSRLRTLEGLVLSSPIPSYAIITDPTVNVFMDRQAEARPGERQLYEMEMQYSAELLDSLYDFKETERSANELHRTIADAYGKNFPSVVKEYGERLNAFKEGVAGPGQVFGNQYRRLLCTPDSRPLLTERLAASAGYFPERIAEFASFLHNLPDQIDNAQIRKRLHIQVEALTDSLDMREHLIKTLADTPFSAEALLCQKREYLSGKERGGARKSAKSKSAVKAEKQPDEIQNRELFDALVAWRRSEAKTRDIAAFKVMSTRTIIHVSNRQPATLGELLMVKGCGAVTVKQYGEAILEVIRSVRDKS